MFQRNCERLSKLSSYFVYILLLFLIKLELGEDFQKWENKEEMFERNHEKRSNLQSHFIFHRTYFIFILDSSCRLEYIYHTCPVFYKQAEVPTSQATQLFVDVKDLMLYNLLSNKRTIHLNTLHSLMKERNVVNVNASLLVAIQSYRKNEGKTQLTM